MKKLTFCFVTALLLSCINATGVNARTKPIPINATEAAEVKSLLLRIDEINAMDKIGMTASEKKQLRKEVRATKKRVNELGGGVYVSVGALIIILLLLIILL